MFIVKTAPTATRLHGVVMPFAVFCCPKKKNRAIDPPCLDPLDFGESGEPDMALLMRRGRVGMFASRADAEHALAKTGKACKGQAWLREFAFIVLECKDRSACIAFDDRDDNLTHCHLCGESEVYADLESCHDCSEWVCPECCIEVESPDGDSVGVLCGECENNCSA